MSKYDDFIRMVETEAVFMCLSRPTAGIRPSAIMSVALQTPQQVLNHNTENLRFQAQELVDWFFGGPDPEWMPESLMFEEVEVEEVIEEYIDEEDGEEDDDGEEFEYTFEEDFVEGDF